ncbi:hypothetical protein C0993_011773 [Termitomyces sp. T159_Od127]|nr:hypothetical protein C0993_011773 [Termitomyces sp. T159_Od127]
MIRVKLLKNLPGAPMSKLQPPSSVKRTRSHLTTSLTIALPKPVTAVPASQDESADIVMKDKTKIDPKLVNAELTEYIDEGDSSNLAPTTEVTEDTNAEGEDNK